MFNLQPFLDLINSKYCTHEYNILNFSDLEKVDKTFFKITKYQSEKKHNCLAKDFWSQCHILRIIYVLYMYYMRFCWLFLGFFRPRRFLYVFLLAFACFSCFFLRPRRFLYVFFLAFLGCVCVRGDLCMCFCWLLLAFLGFVASAAIFVCAFAGFCWLFLGFWRPRRFLYVLLLAFVGFFGVRGDPCMAFVGFFGVRVELWLKQVSYRIPVPMLYSSLWLKNFFLLNQMPKQIADHRGQKNF